MNSCRCCATALPLAVFIMSCRQQQRQVADIIQHMMWQQRQAQARCTRTSQTLRQHWSPIVPAHARQLLYCFVLLPVMLPAICDAPPHLKLEQLLIKVVDGGGLVRALHVLLLGEALAGGHAGVVQHTLEVASEGEAAGDAHSAYGIQPARSVHACGNVSM